MTQTQRQSVVPSQAIDEEVVFFVTAGTVELSDQLRDVLSSAHLEVRQAYPQVYKICCRDGDLQQASTALTTAMTTHELDIIFFHLAATDSEPTPNDLMQSRNIRHLISWSEGRWIGDLMASDGLTTFFQPIVFNSNPTRVYAYECLMRAVDHAGQIIYPDRLINAARQSGRLDRLDHAARIKAIETAAGRKLDCCVFINFSPQFIEDPPDSWERTIEAALNSGIEPSRFVFEVIESDEITDLTKLLDILESCREAGCRVALDDVGTGYNSLQLMSQVRPDFIKLDMELIRDIDRDAYKSCVAGKLLELARELGVYTVVEGVETNGEWQWSVDHGADFSQGYLFARPAADPPLVEPDDRKLNPEFTTR